MITVAVLLLLAVVLIASLVLSACQPAGSTTGSGKKVCQVTDTGGIDDQSFNATAWAGAQRAEKELGYVHSEKLGDIIKGRPLEQICRP